MKHEVANLSRKRILLTGGVGFVGRAVYRMLSQHHDVLCVDTSEHTYGRFTIEELRDLRIERVDIRDDTGIHEILTHHDPEVVIHLAAVHFIPECERDPARAVSINVGGTVNLLQHCSPGTRFVFASSGAVYAPSVDPHDESSPIEPSDVYGLSKMHAESYVRHLAATRGLAAVVLRLFNVIGAGETNPHLLPEVMAQLRAGSRSLRLGNIESRRDYVWVEDAARAFVLAALQGSIPEGSVATANIGTGKAHSVREMLDLLRRISGRDFSVETDPERLRTIDRPVLHARRQRAADLFGWEPSSDLYTALENTWRHPDLPGFLEERYTQQPVLAE